MTTYQFIDTHAHIEGHEFDDDRNNVISRAKEAGASKILIPAIDRNSVANVLKTCETYPNYTLPMIGLHPEEVGNNWKQELDYLHSMLLTNIAEAEEHLRFIAVGEIGLDFYWSREFEKEQLAAFEEQITWSIDTQLPIMIHCRKAQNEMVRLIRKYEKDLPGGVFHCFTGNIHEAEELLQFDKFCLGIGGVVTFKKSNLPDTVRQIPLDRIVLETDAPYMAPTPHRGTRNESAFIVHILEKIAECKGVAPEVIAQQTTDNANKVFNLNHQTNIRP